MLNQKELNSNLISVNQPHDLQKVALCLLFFIMKCRLMLKLTEQNNLENL